MPHIDATVTLTVVVAICATISPSITALINNLYLLRLKKMELKQQERENTVMHIRKIYEDYLQNTGRCIAFYDDSSLKAYGESYFRVLLFAPDELRIDMISANNAIVHGKMKEATAIIEKLTPKIHAIIRTL